MPARSVSKCWIPVSAPKSISSDYQKPGDNLAIVINLANNVVAGIGVSSYLDSPTDVVTLDAKMGAVE